MELVVPSKGAINSNCCYYGQGREAPRSICVSAWAEGQAQVAMSSVLGGVIDGFHGAGLDRPRPAWRGLLSWQMRFGFPAGAAPSAFIVANSSLGNSHPPQSLTKPV